MFSNNRNTPISSCEAVAAAYGVTRKQSLHAVMQALLLAPPLCLILCAYLLTSSSSSSSSSSRGSTCIDACRHRVDATLHQSLCITAAAAANWLAASPHTDLKTDSVDVDGVSKSTK